jgi:hypothetical protein
MMRSLRCVTSAILVFALGTALVRLGSRSTVVVTWKTVSEVNTAGFLLYRGETLDGPFQLLAETPIPAAGDPLVGASYRYEDTDVEWGQRYYYRLEEVERSGTVHPLDMVADGQAGAGWPWALGVGSLLAVVTSLLGKGLSGPGGRHVAGQACGTAGAPVTD